MKPTVAVEIAAPAEETTDKMGDVATGEATTPSAEEAGTTSDELIVVKPVEVETADPPAEIMDLMDLVEMALPGLPAWAFPVKEDRIAELADSASATGQIVVVTAMVSVTICPADAEFRAGQFVTDAAQLVRVYTEVANTVNVVEGPVLVALAAAATDC